MAPRDGLRGFVTGMNRSGEIQERDLARRKKTKNQPSPKVLNTRDQSLRGYLSKLERTDHIIRLQKEVDPAVNMGALQWKAYNELGKATIFDNIRGYPNWRACSQIFTDREKWALGLNLTEQELLSSMSKKLKNPIDAEVRIDSHAPCKEVILKGSSASLLDIPVVTQSENDGGPFISSGMAIFKDPDTGIRNMSIHRMQVFDAQHSGFILLPRQARRIHEKYIERNQNTPVAVVIGAHPAIFFSSAYTTNYGVDELAIAGGLLGEPVRLVPAETVDLEVPADAEVIIEGEILLGEKRFEGPYGEVPGTYAEAENAEVFKVTAITRRKDPIYYSLHSGIPTTCAQATTGFGIEIATMEHLSRVEGGMDIHDVRVIPAGGLMLLVIKMTPKVEGQAKTALMAALSGPYLHPKLAIAVDDDIDANDLRQIMWSMTTRVHGERDIGMIKNTRTFALDKISPIADGGSQFERIGTKWFIDATKPALSHPDKRANFDRAMPKNFNSVDLRSFLPDQGKF